MLRRTYRYEQRPILCSFSCPTPISHSKHRQARRNHQWIFLRHTHSNPTVLNRRDLSLLPRTAGINIMVQRMDRQRYPLRSRHHRCSKHTTRVAHFTSTVPKIDEGFRSIGTLLLELCFGKPLEQHELWNQAGFSAAKTNPMMRQFVACEWSKDVEGEAGEQYANAVKFCLHQCPTILQDEVWRTDFAQAVVWPLQQCYESMQPSKRIV
jgi:hypothetical protein